MLAFTSDQCASVGPLVRFVIQARRAGTTPASDVSRRSEDSIRQRPRSLYKVVRCVKPKGSARQLYTLLSLKHPRTLDQLWSALIKNAPDLETKLKYGSIFSLNGVSPNLSGAMAAIGSTTPPQISFTLTKGSPPPVFVWEEPTVGVLGTTPLLTKFGIKLFDDSDTEVFDTGYLTGTQILPYGTTPVQSSYSLDSAF